MDAVPSSTKLQMLMAPLQGAISTSFEPLHLHNDGPQRVPRSVDVLVHLFPGACTAVVESKGVLEAWIRQHPLKVNLPATGATN